MYLPSEVVASILHFVGTQPSLRTRIVFTFLDTAKDGHPGFGNARRTLNLWLRWRGEPFVWGIEKQKLADYLKTQGLFLQTSADHAELRQRYLTAAGTELAQLAEGECIGVADKL
jgi:O-methyltransferase involved in polyketide biosynthesis